MTIQRMDHVGIVVDDLAAATAFFVERSSSSWRSGSAEARLSNDEGRPQAPFV
jgi:catechol 2,3-dioxygenase-like lactoylglutathione lyase family enzyme